MTKNEMFARLDCVLDKIGKRENFFIKKGKDIIKDNYKDYNIVIEIDKNNYQIMLKAYLVRINVERLITKEEALEQF